VRDKDGAEAWHGESAGVEARLEVRLIFHIGGGCGRVDGCVSVWSITACACRGICSDDDARRQVSGAQSLSLSFVGVLDR
jgi:hypothetical protein